MGKARNTVGELLRLNALPETIKHECRTSPDVMTTKSILLQVSRLDDPEERGLDCGERLTRERPQLARFVPAERTG